MKRLACSTAVLVALALVGFDWLRTDRLTAAVAGENDYFEALTRRADIFKFYSLRDAAQLRDKRLGGYSMGEPETGSGVFYSPSTDTDRNKQDAAKVMVPAFYSDTTLSQAISATDTTLKLTLAYKPSYPINRIIRVDREVMTVTLRPDDYTITVQRGTNGSSAAAHAAGAVVELSTNSLRHQVRVPLMTEDNHTYFFTWDAFWTDSYLGVNFNHKAFQFTSGGRTGDIWFQPGVRYNSNQCPAGSIGMVNTRSMNKLGGPADWNLTNGDVLGPGVTATDPVSPSVGSFCVQPNKWVRWFVQLKQKSRDYDYVDVWVADETRDPVQILSNIPLSVLTDGSMPNQVVEFWLEFNSSVDGLHRPDHRTLISYVRNIAVLRDAGDPRGFLVRPVPGAQPVDGPSAPRNVRIIQGS